MEYCINCRQPLVHNGINWVHEIHNEITSKCTEPLRCLSGPEYLQCWEGIGATHKQFDDYHEFFLGACPVWNRSRRQIEQFNAQLYRGKS